MVKWDESKVHRVPKGSHEGGEFVGVGGVVSAVESWAGKVADRLGGHAERRQSAGVHYRSRAELAATIASGEKHRTQLSGGLDGAVHLVEHNDGHFTIHKTYGGRAKDAWIKPTPKDRNHSELMMARMGEAIGAPVPSAVRDPKNGDLGAYYDYMPGLPDYRAWRNRTWGTTTETATFEPPKELEDSLQGRLLGLLDVVARNQDRHDGNYMLDANMNPIGIDHGRAFYETGTGATPTPWRGRLTPFGHYLTNDQGQWKDNDLDPANVDAIIKIIDGLGDEFRAAGHGDWHGDVMARLAQVRKHAKGTVKLL